jgi:hypothetical protein
MGPGRPSASRRLKRRPRPVSDTRPQTAPEASGSRRAPFRSHDPYIIKSSHPPPLQPIADRVRAIRLFRARERARQLHRFRRPPPPLNLPSGSLVIKPTGEDALLYFLRNRLRGIPPEAWDLAPVLKKADGQKVTDHLAPVPSPDAAPADCFPCFLTMGQVSPMELDQAAYSALFRSWTSLPWQSRGCPQALEGGEAARLGEAVTDEERRVLAWRARQEMLATLSATVEMKRIMWWGAEERRRQIIAEGSYRAQHNRHLAREARWQGKVLEELRMHLLRFEEFIAGRIRAFEDEEVERRFEAEKTVLELMDPSQRGMFMAHLVKDAEEHIDKRTRRLWAMLRREENVLEVMKRGYLAVHDSFSRVQALRLVALHAAERANAIRSVPCGVTCACHLSLVTCQCLESACHGLCPEGPRAHLTALCRACCPGEWRRSTGG